MPSLSAASMAPLLLSGYNGCIRELDAFADVPEPFIHLPHYVSNAVSW